MRATTSRAAGELFDGVRAFASTLPVTSVSTDDKAAFGPAHREAVAQRLVAAGRDDLAEQWGTKQVGQ